MRKIIPFVLLLTLLSIVLFGCNSLSNEALIKVSVAKSNGIGVENSNFFAVYEEKQILNIFERTVSSASKQPGIVNVLDPDYDFEVIYANGDKQGFHLWLREKDQRSTLMYATDSNTIYTISQDMTNKLMELLQTP